jgi:hypothetical protein
VETKLHDSPMAQEGPGCLHLALSVRAANPLSSDRSRRDSGAAGSPVGSANRDRKQRSGMGHKRSISFADIATLLYQRPKVSC